MFSLIQSSNCWIFHAVASLLYYSAAKAPFLAQFRVKPCGIQQLENLGMSDITNDDCDTNDTSNNKDLPWQACIFKVGDDVRQVCYGTIVF